MERIRGKRIFCLFLASLMIVLMLWVPVLAQDTETEGEEEKIETTYQDTDETTGEESTCTITFDANGGAYSGSNEVQFTVGESMIYKDGNLNVDIPTLSGCAFLGWNTSNDGTGAYLYDENGAPVYQGNADYWSYDDSVSPIELIWNYNSDIVLYAQWDEQSSEEVQDPVSEEGTEDLQDPDPEGSDEHVHELTLVEEKAATCTDDGYEAYYQCECGKLFSDEAGENEITSPVVITALGHSWDSGKVTKYPSTSKKGVITYTCKRCSETKTKSIAIRKKANASGTFKGKIKNKKIYVGTAKSGTFKVKLKLKKAKTTGTKDYINCTVIGKDYFGKQIYKKTFKYDSIGRKKGTYYYWYDVPKLVKPGRYTFVIKSKKGRTYTIDYKVKNYAKFTEKLKNCSKEQLTGVNYGSYLDIAPADGGMLYGKIKSSNPKIISVGYDGYAGKYYIDGHGKPGKATLTITLKNGKIYKVKARIYKPFLEWSTYRLYKGEKFKDRFYNYSGKLKYWTTNSKVATVSSNGVVKAKGFGTCYIYCKGGKWKGKTKVTVKHLPPNFGATIDSIIDDYTYELKFKNWGSKPLYIFKKGKSGAYITIKPHKSKTLYKYYDGLDEVEYYFKYDGKTYKGWFTWDQSAYYKNGSWYNTYWNSYSSKFEYMTDY